MLLVITEGPRKGLIFPLEDRPVTIGRDPASTIAVEDTRASRRHASIEPDEAGGWMVRDWGSTNQTYLNGEPVSSALLKEGDLIRIASTTLRFQVPVEDEREEISLDMDPQTIQLALRNSGELRSRKLGLSEALFQISMLGDLELSPEEFLHKAMKVLVSNIEFTGWAWVDWPQGPENRHRVRGERYGYPITNEDADLSQTLLERVVNERKGFTSAELDGQFEESMEIRPNRITSAMAVPLLTHDHVRSVLYMDREEGLSFFDRDDLEWLAVLGSQIGVNLENISLFAQLQSAFEELHRSQKELIRSEKLAAIGRLASGFAHDLNNPLSSILGFLELARRAVPNAVAAGDAGKVPDFLNKAKAAADFCRALSRNLLAFARQKSFSECESTSFSVKTIVEATLNICNASVTRSGAEVSVTIPEDTMLSGDPSTLQQVVMNLVTNAADAIGENPQDCPGRIDVSASENDLGVILRVSDNGPGIPHEIQSNIYDALFTTKKDDRGTGLGLYVVRQIVEESGGSIEFSSEIGQGTEFSVVLPRKLARLGDDFDTTVTTLEPSVEPAH